MLERSEGVKSPGAYVTEFHAAIFAWPCVLSARNPVLWCSDAKQKKCVFFNKNCLKKNIVQKILFLCVFLLLFTI